MGSPNRGRELRAVAPCTAPAPDPNLVEARQILVEDVLPSLGCPKNGVAAEIEETSVNDIRRARRLTERAVDLLAAAVE